MVPYHTIAFSQQKLRAALRRAAEQDIDIRYGFVIHARRHNQHPTLGIITLQGESMALTDRLVEGLEETPLWLFGHARVTLGGALPVAEAERSKRGKRKEELPLGALQMYISTFDVNTGVTKHLVQVEAAVRAETLVQPLLLLAHDRPPSWPA